jgi:branched-chain amino acid transport system permease protein
MACSAKKAERRSRFDRAMLLQSILDAVAAQLGSVTPKFILDLFTDYGIFLIGTLGLYLLLSAGQVSLGHAALVGVGAYASAVMATKFNLPLWLALPISGVVGLVFGGAYCVLLGWRLSGFYLAIGTFALGEMLINIGLNTDYLGGAIGLSGIPIQSTWPIVLPIVLLVIFMIWRLERSRFGLAFRALKDHPLVAGSMGVNVARTKMTVWMIAGFITGIAGCLHAHRVTVVTPTEFGIYTSVTFLMAPLLGGLRSFVGTMLGAAVVYFGPWLTTTDDPRDRLMFYGALLVLLMVLRPQGLLAVRPRGRGRMGGTPGSEDAARVPPSPGRGET